MNLIESVYVLSLVVYVWAALKMWRLYCRTLDAEAAAEAREGEDR